MKRLFKVLNIGESNEKTLDFGYLSEEDIKRETKGFKYDEELEIWTRKGSNNGYYTLNY